MEIENANINIFEYKSSLFWDIYDKHYLVFYELRVLFLTQGLNKNTDYYILILIEQKILIAEVKKILRLLSLRDKTSKIPSFTIAN